MKWFIFYSFKYSAFSYPDNLIAKIKFPGHEKNGTILVLYYHGMVIKGCRSNLCLYNKNCTPISTLYGLESM
jgi:hypothetical protein